MKTSFYLNKDIRSRSLIMFFLIVLVPILFFSAFLHQKDLPYTDNDVIRKYQYNKIVAKSSSLIDTIIVGDSSAGNAIDSEVWSEISGTHAMNLSLTGSFGLAGTYNMIRLSKVHLPKLKNVVIMQSIDIWHRPFVVEGFNETLFGMDSADFKLALSNMQFISSRLEALFNPREIYWWISYKLGSKSAAYVDGDYLVQGAPIASSTENVASWNDVSIRINSDQREVVFLIGQFCSRENLNCILVNGPISEAYIASNKGNAYVMDIKYFFTQKIPGITSVPELFVFPSSKIGDAVDHIARSHRAEVTKQYYNIISDYLDYKYE